MVPGGKLQVVLDQTRWTAPQWESFVENVGGAQGEDVSELDLPSSLSCSMQQGWPSVAAALSVEAGQAAIPGAWQGMAGKNMF